MIKVIRHGEQLGSSRARANTRLHAIGKPRPSGTTLQMFCGRRARSMVVPGLAEPEGLSDGCGIDTIGSGPAA